MYYLAVAESRKGALSEFASKVSAMYHVTLFVLWSLLAILQPVDAGDARGCPLAANVSSLADSIPASALPCPDGLELKYLLLGTGTQNYTCLSGDEGQTPESAGAIGEWISLFSRLLESTQQNRSAGHYDL